MRPVLLKSTLIAALIVAAGVCIIAVDPYLLAAYRHIAPTSQSLRAVAAAAEHLLDPLVVLLGVILYVLLIRTDRLRRFQVFAGTMLTQGALVSFLKKVFSRMRPADLPDRVAFFGPHWDGEHNSFPGGHAAGAFALAAVLSAWHPRWWWAFYLGAGLVTLSRIHLDRHFFGDCFVGAWLGYWIAQCFLVYVGGRPASPAAKGHSAASST